MLSFPVAYRARVLNLSDFELTFSADFSNQARKWFHYDGGPFTTRMESWGGLRTLPKNREQQLYVDPHFIPSPSGTDSLGRNDAPVGKPLGYNPFGFDDGTLTITAIRTPPAMRHLVDRPYLSGIVGTDLSFSQQFGYFEVRAQFPRGRGLWPAFWMVSSGASDEIDVVEAIGEQTRIYHSVHLPNVPKYLDRPVSPPGFEYSARMYSYGVAWSERELIFYIDGRETTRVNAKPLRDSPPMYLLANLAVGGDWPGSPPAQTQFPAVMRIQYIRAYQWR